MIPREGGGRGEKREQKGVAELVPISWATLVKDPKGGRKEKTQRRS